VNSDTISPETSLARTSLWMGFLHSKYGPGCRYSFQRETKGRRWKEFEVALRDGISEAGGFSARQRLDERKNKGVNGSNLKTKE